MKRLTLLLFLLLLAACDRDDLPPAPPTSTSPVTTASPTTALPTETAVPPAATTIPPTDTIPVIPIIVTPPVWATPMAPEEPFSRTAVTAAEQTAWLELSQADPPSRDDVQLAAAYRNRTAQPTPPAPVIEPLTVGIRQIFNIANFDDNTVIQIEANLLAVSDHAYFWFDTGSGSVQPGPTELMEVAETFDTIYETNVFYFGSENNPGIDGDPRLYIVHASPLALCNVSLDTADLCPLAGYFSSRDIVPQTADPTSNAHELFVMNANNFGSSFYLNVLGHEFRHMIEDNYDRGDEDWEVEGSAIFAEELLGYPATGQQRGDLFLSAPDQQLNSWTDGNTIPHYGQGYVLNRYIFDRLGVDLYRQFAMHPVNGLRAVDAVAQANDLDITGESLFLDWLAALAIHNDLNAAVIYQFQGTSLDTAESASLQVSDNLDNTVSQYAADYYELPATGSYTLQFTGNALTPLLDTLPASGQAMWYAQRSNYSNPRLTREVDLRGLTSATLNYAVYTDIEYGYDFAYAAVSTDGGNTWQGLATDHMQGLDPADNPSGSALTERFYTGRSDTWLEETADLTPYTGQVIQIRFEYVTDPILTFGGFVLDNISIPEVGFYDDAETIQDGWVAEGFTRATGYLPQTWYIQLVTYTDGVPTVQRLSLTNEQTISLVIDGVASGGKRPILIIGAVTPFTLEQAHYQLSLE